MGLLILAGVVIDLAFALFVLWTMGKFARIEAQIGRMFLDLTEHFEHSTKTLDAHSDDLQGAFEATTRHDETIAALQDSVLQLIERVNVISSTQDVSNGIQAELQSIVKTLMSMPAPASKKELEEVKKGLQPETKKEVTASNGTSRKKGTHV